MASPIGLHKKILTGGNGAWEIGSGQLRMVIKNPGRNYHEKNCKNKADNGIFAPHVLT
ncbi:hypothetical protein MAMMFC1_01420 [Methylomusa anaerophila]|uniref:Uncharacterized protein n=1 Tax=Methylomusa anaerophila TaxID=1930071 RepID=A0A348AI61_9FIRM|nr:hypothetical protein MAMMFC1_01420 [Methylomusa anaerophila]